MPQVTVNKHTKDKLIAIHIDEGHTSIDSVIKSLLLRAGYDDLKGDGDD